MLVYPYFTAVMGEYEPKIEVQFEKMLHVAKGSSVRLECFALGKQVSTLLTDGLLAPRGLPCLTGDCHTWHIVYLSSLFKKKCLRNLQDLLIFVKYQEADGGGAAIILKTAADCDPGVGQGSGFGLSTGNVFRDAGILEVEYSRSRTEMLPCHVFLYFIYL